MQFCSTKTHEQNIIFCGPSSAKCFNFKSNELNFHSQQIYWENSFTLFPLFTAFAVQQKHMRIGLRLVSDWKCRHEWRRTLYRICVYVWRCLGRSQIDWHLCRTRSNWIRARTHTHRRKAQAQSSGRRRNKKKKTHKTRKQMVNERRNSIAISRRHSKCICVLVTEAHAELKKNGPRLNERDAFTAWWSSVIWMRHFCECAVSTVRRWRIAGSATHLNETFYTPHSAMSDVRFGCRRVCVLACVCICKPFFYGFRVSFVSETILHTAWKYFLFPSVSLFTADFRMH